ncbi:MAG: AMP-binding protein [Burkholderiales bacterium]
MQTIHDLVRLAAARNPGQLAIVDDRTDRCLTYRQLIEEIDAYAAGFLAAGVRPGTIVATVLPNLYEHALAILSLHRLGAAPALINPRLKPEEAAGLVRQGEMNAAVMLPDEAGVRAVSAALPQGAPLITVGPGPAGSRTLESCRADPKAIAPWRGADPNGLSLVLYTSGTTGLPKGVMVPHRATDARVLYLSMQCGVVHGTHNRVIGLMPMFHAVGFYSGLLGALAYDGTYHVCSAFDPKRAVDTIERAGITLLYGSPTHLHGILSAPNFSPERMQSVQTVIYAGAAMPGPALDRLGAAFAGRKVVNIYGTTEIMNSLYLPDPVGRPHVYRPGYYSNIRVAKIGGGVDDIAEIGEEGELLVDATADATFLGYLNSPEATAEKLQGGWYRTGDLTVRRADGDVEVRGRVDEMIITGAENVHPYEVEATLARHPGVAEAVVIGVPDERWGEIVVACIKPGPERPGESELDRFCLDSTLANYKRPRAYLLFDEIPRNAANKVLRHALRESAQAALAQRKV